MRTFIAILISCIVMLLAFSLPWSLFVGTPSEYPDSFSWIFTVLVFAAAYQLPISFVLALAVVWPIERIGSRLTRISQRRVLRAVAWLLVASVTYVAGAVTARRDLAALAIISGIVAAGVATFLFSRIIHTHDRSSHTTAG